MCKGVTQEFSSSGLLGCNKGKCSSINKQNGSCPWVLLVSRPLDLYIWTMKVYEEKNYYLHTRDAKSCTQSFIAKKLASQIEMTPTCLTYALQEEFQMKYGVGVSKSKIFKEKAIAQHQIHGNYEKQY